MVTDSSVSGGEISVTARAGGYGIGFPVAVSAETAYTLSFTNTGNGKISIGFYDASWNYLSDRDGTTPPYTFTTPAGCAFAVFVVTPNVFSESSKTASVKNVQLELGSTATSYAPYSNICPISGFAGLTAHRTGKNLFGGSYNTSYSIFIPAGTEVTISIDTHEAPATQFRAYRADNTMIDFWSVSDTALDGTRLKKTITFTENVYSVKFQNASADNIQIELGSTASAYSPYVGTSLSLTWSDHGAIYGGTAEWIGGDSWTVTVTHGVVDLGAQTWTQDSNYSYRFICKTVNSMPVQTTNRQTPILCSEFAPITDGRSFANVPNDAIYLGYLAGEWDKVVFVHASEYSDASAFTAGVSGVQLYYPLATPTTFTITTTELFSLLQGENNLWSDAGDVSVEYRADTKLFIEKKITAAIAAALNS